MSVCDECKPPVVAVIRIRQRKGAVLSQSSGEVMMATVRVQHSFYKSKYFKWIPIREPLKVIDKERKKSFDKQERLTSGLSGAVRLEKADSESKDDPDARGCKHTRTTRRGQAFV